MAREFITALLPLLVIVTALVPTSVSDTDALYIPERASCACPGDVLTYICDITRVGNTIWNGSAFNCIKKFNEIILRHSQFGTGSGTSGSCNGIVARSIGVGRTNDFISELNVTVSTSLHNKTIQCSHSAARIRIIGTSTIAVAITNDAVLEPPDDVHIADIQDGHAILEWRPAIGVPLAVCLSDSIDYSVTSNCSSTCSIVTSTTANCSGPQQLPAMEPLTCAFSVQSVVCGNLTGRPSIPAVFTFHDQGPPNPPLTLALEEVGPTWVFLSWERSFLSSAMISFYEILVRAVNSDAAATVNISTSDDRTHFSVTGLIPGATYEISVVAVSERGAGMTLRSLPSVPIEFMTESLESIEVQALCSVVVWYNPDIFCEFMISGYDVRFYSPQQGTKNVTRSTGANQTFYIIQDEDGLVDKHDINVQVRVIHENLIEGEWSKGISLGCERPTTPPEAPSVYFELKGVTYMNNSAASLIEVGEGENALLCKTNNESCCGTPPNRFGEFYYPNGIKVPIAKQQQGFYRNRGEKIIRLNRRDGATLPTGRYRCEIPDVSGSMQNIYITLNV